MNVMREGAGAAAIVAICAVLYSSGELFRAADIMTGGDGGVQQHAARNTAQPSLFGLFTRSSVPADPEAFARSYAESINLRKGQRVGWHNTTFFESAIARGSTVEVILTVKASVAVQTAALPAQKAKQSTIRQNCSDKQIRQAIDNGATIIVAYRNENGVYLTDDIRVDARACA